MRRAAPWIISTGVLTLLGMGIWLARRPWHAHAAEAAPPASNPTGGQAAAPREVEVVSVQRTTMSRSLEFPATIEAFEQTELYAKSSGYLADVRFDIGDSVRAGDTLAVIDVPELSAEFDQAQAVLAAKRALVEAATAKVLNADANIESARSEQIQRDAEVELERITTARKEELFKSQAIPQQEFDEARIRLDVARAQAGVAVAKHARAEGEKRVAQADLAVAEADVGVAQAALAREKALLEYTRIRAPFDGVITRRLVDRGALVQPGTGNRTTPLLEIQRVDQLRIFVDVPETEVSHVLDGVPAKVKPYGLPGVVVAGKVARIASALNSATRTMRTEIDVSNADGRLMSGMYAQAALEVDQRTNVLVVPTSVRLVDGKEAYVLVVKNDRAVRTPIKVGLEDGARFEVLDGLEEGAIVVLSPKGINSDTPVRAAAKKGSL